MMRKGLDPRALRSPNTSVQGNDEAKGDVVRVILRNDDAEALLLDIRAGRHAARQDVDERAAGAFLIFPTSVVTPGRAGAQLVYPLRADVEPGCLVTAAGTGHVGGVVGTVAVTGAFHWTVGSAEAPLASYRFRRRGREIPTPPWADQLPRSQALGSKGRAGLIRQQIRIRRHGRTAEHWLFTLTEQMIRRACRGPLGRAIDYRPAVDEDDVVQRGLQTAVRLLPVYASKDRPPCSWLGMLHLDGRRDMRREVSHLDWLPEDAVAAVTLADACGVRRLSDPSATWAALCEGADRLGEAPPGISAPELDAVLRARALLVHELAGARADGSEVCTTEGSQVSARVARLVSDDDELIAAAAASDSRALVKVGDKVVRQLRDGRESPPAARRRCWEQFQQSGQLFTTPVGLTRFAEVADPLSLAAIDECLRRAAGLGVGAGVGAGVGVAESRRPR
jgi:hypothetical protein